MAKEPRKVDLPVDLGVLSADQIAEIELQAEQQVKDEAVAEAKKQLLARKVKEAKQKVGLEEEMVEIFIDLAPYADRVLLDNHAFLQGQTYTVRSGVARTLQESMQNTWKHQAEIDGKPENFYRRMKNQRILPNGGVVNTTQILRA